MPACMHVLVLFKILHFYKIRHVFTLNLLQYHILNLCMVVSINFNF